MELSRSLLRHKESMVDFAVKDLFFTVKDSRKEVDLTVEQLEGYNRWIDSLREGKVVVIAGARGSGKTCLGAKIAEFIHASFGMPIFWVGLPPDLWSSSPDPRSDRVASFPLINF